jgi:uncharacterized membrane-anchored protein
MRSRHFSIGALFILVVTIPVVASLAATENPSAPATNALAEAFRSAQWTTGPATAPLEGIAQLQLPPDHMAAQGDDTRRIMEAMRNPPNGTEVGVVFTRNGNWFVVFEFDEMGYVKDDEKGTLNADALLESIKRGTETSNKERAKRGWPTLTIIGWEQKPRYDEQTHNLTWAIRGESQGGPVINYNTRLLGRSGVMRVTLVADPGEMPTALPQFRTLLTGYTFTKGNRYAEWVQGDKVATVGLTALVTGGAAAVAVKSGAAKWLWKVLVVAGIGLLAFFKKIFKRGSA